MREAIANCPRIGHTAASIASFAYGTVSKRREEKHVFILLRPPSHRS